ncbi:Phospho-2-dehydro-3-deoxyheptonate aldolase [Balamuthia mandrillaris]
MEKYKDELVILMRVYFEKPRTTVGWKGLINDPFLDDSFQINKGLRMARKLLCDLNDMGVPAASEFLDTISPQYIGDLVSWGAIGARTTESQVHRELASGISSPVGFKNGTDGGVRIAIDALKAVAAPHHFLSVTKQGLSAIVCTTGNDACHVILRGGNKGPNYSAKDVDTILKELKEAKVLNPRVMIDCSHGNSSKNHRNQPVVCQDVAQQVASGNMGIFGLMIESHLEEGRQDAITGAADKLKYGQSITDACVSWQQTLPMLDCLAQAVRSRRATAANGQLNK